MERKGCLKTIPILLHYYITNRCNSRCTFCNVWQETPKIDASLADVSINLQHAWDAGCTFVDFTGGEPLLHEALPKFLQIAKKIGFITSVTTNCILFPKRAHELKENIDLLHFSLDADNKDLHDRLHGANSFSLVMKSIAIAREHRLNPDLLFTYSNENIDSFKGILEISRKNKLVVILDPVFSPNGPEQISSITHQKAIRFSHNKGIYLNTAHLAFRSQGGNHVRNPSCKAVDTTIVIMPDNKLALPCYHHRIQTIPIENGLKALLKDKNRSEALAHQGKYSFCEGCHINCYFDPSYTKLHNMLHIKSLKAKLFYTIDKYIYYKNPIPLKMISALLKRMLRFLLNSM